MWQGCAPTFLLEGHPLQQDVLGQGQVLIAAAAPNTRVTALLNASADICTAVMHCVCLATSLPLFVLLCPSPCLSLSPFVCLPVTIRFSPPHPFLFFWPLSGGLCIRWGLIFSGLWVPARMQPAVKGLSSWTTSARSLLQILRQGARCQHCPETAQSRLPLQHHQTEI